eukprot:GFYU01011871.1.p1 GENE.GFYU01011871.1~~GFYU01011871.1.p1  ORF type:complete len:344 (+),score=91.44 GFYU01011871.1:280-1311(+)
MNFLSHQFLRTVVCIAFYYACSIGIILYNKWLFSVYGLAFPLFITFCHMTISSALALLITVIFFEKPEISWDAIGRRIVPVGVTIGLDIALSNLSYLTLTVSFMEMLKSAAPFWVLVFSILFKIQAFRWDLFASTTLIVSGIALAGYGEIGFQWHGVILCSLAAVMAGLRLVLSQMVLQKSELGLNSITAVLYISPICSATILPGFLAMEFTDLVSSSFMKPEHLGATALFIGVGAFIAFLLNISEYLLIANTSALTICVAGVFKTVFVVHLSSAVFKNTLSTLNIVGFSVCFLGICLYNYLKFRDATSATQKVDYNALPSQDSAWDPDISDEEEMLEFQDWK